MQDRELVEIIRDAESAEALKNATDRIAGEILAAPGAIAHAWASGDRIEADKAGMVLLDLGALGIQPLLAESEDKAGLALVRYRLLTQAVELHLPVRSRLFRRLDGLLDDETPLQSEQPEPGWPEGIPVRVCDHAYISIHRLLRVDRTSGRGFPMESDFMKLVLLERDRQIHRWRRSQHWRTLRSGE